jgi:hypothetical protein
MWATRRPHDNYALDIAFALIEGHPPSIDGRMRLKIKVRWQYVRGTT